MEHHWLSVAISPAEMGSFAVITDSPQALAVAERVVADAIVWRA